MLTNKIEYVTEIEPINQSDRLNVHTILLSFSTREKAQAAIDDFRVMMKIKDSRTRRMMADKYKDNYPNKYVTEFEVFPHGIIYVKTTLYEKVSP